MAGDRGLRHGASASVRKRRLRPRSLDWLGVRFRHRTHRHDPLCHQRHPARRLGIHVNLNQMKISICWLKQYLGFNGLIELLAERTTTLTLKVAAALSSERGSVSRSTHGFSRRMDFPESDCVGEAA